MCASFFPLYDLDDDSELDITDTLLQLVLNAETTDECETTERSKR